jgi:hypothetical protein
VLGTKPAEKAFRYWLENTTVEMCVEEQFEEQSQQKKHLDS